MEGFRVRPLTVVKDHGESLSKLFLIDAEVLNLRLYDAV
jgi:hypothetical protein